MIATGNVIEMEPLLTSEQVAAWLQKTDQRIRDMARAGLIPAVKVGGTWRFERAKLEEWLQGQQGRTETTAEE